jgi:SAM-dependent methyltransferase
MSRFSIREHFGEFASRYDHEALKAGPGLREISERELATVERRVGVVQGRRVLDAGVGTGRFARMLVRRGAQVVGVDLTHEMLEVCARNEPRVRLVEARLGSPFPFGNGTFDHVVCIRVIKYLDDWTIALAELRRVIRPTGRLVLEVANRRSLARWGYSRMPVRLVTAGEAARLLASSGFRVQAMDPGVRLPFLMYRWARTRSRLGAVRLVDGMLTRALGRFVFARSLIFTCQADPAWDLLEEPAPP